jgi:S1-C subfamily serine protease
MFTQLTLAAALAVGAPALKEKEPLGTGPGYLGITFTKDTEGLQVTEVKPEGPAAKAGVKEGDVIVKIDGTDINTFADLAQTIAQKKPGETIPIEILRNGQTQTVNVTLGER